MPVRVPEHGTIRLKHVKASVRSLIKMNVDMSTPAWMSLVGLMFAGPRVTDSAFNYLVENFGPYDER